MFKNPRRIGLTIIVPVYNEEKGIEKTIVEIHSDAKLKSIQDIVDTFEVIVVDDGSSDASYRIIQGVNKRYKRVRVIQHKSNLGLGASIATGIRHATKDYITYLPADGQAFLRDIPEGLKVAPNADLVLTYRGIRNDYNSYRQILSNSLMISMKFFFGLSFRDYNWVHIYKRDLFRSIKTKSKGVFYLAEVVARTNKAGFKILEAKAKYHPRSTGYSKNARPRIVIGTLIDLFKLWTELRLNDKIK